MNFYKQAAAALTLAALMLTLVPVTAFAQEPALDAPLVVVQQVVPEPGNPGGGNGGNTDPNAGTQPVSICSSSRA